MVSITLLLLKGQRLLTAPTMIGLRNGLDFSWLGMSLACSAVITITYRSDNPQHNFSSVLIWFTVITGSYSVWTPEENKVWKRNYLLCINIFDAYE